MHIVSVHDLPEEQSTFDEQATGIRTHSLSEFPVKPAGHEQSLTWDLIEHSAFIPQDCGRSHGFKHCPLKQASCVAHSESDEQAGLQVRPLQ